MSPAHAGSVKLTRTKTSKKVQGILWQSENSPAPEVDLSDCQIEKLPNELFGLFSGEKNSLILSQNKIVNFGPGARLNAFSRVEILDLSQNHINKLPHELCALIVLRVLVLDHNQITNVPPAVEHLNNLTLLSIEHNKLESIPKFLAKLPHLEDVRLGGNISLKDPPLAIYSESGCRGVMQYLVREKSAVYEGPLDGIDTDTVLDTAANTVAGLYTASVSDQPKQGIQHDLPRASTKGVAQLLWEAEMSPDDVADFSRLLLTKIPAEMFAVFISSEKRTLKLNINLLQSFEGNMNSLRNLQTLDLSKNRLKSLPDALIAAESLRRIDVSYNQLSAIPLVLSKLPLLRSIYVKHNQIQDLPHELTSMPYLQSLQVLDNPLFYFNDKARRSGIPDIHVEEAITSGDDPLLRLLCKLANVQYRPPMYVEDSYMPNQGRKMQALGALRVHQEAEDQAVKDVNDARIRFSEAHLRYTELQSRLIEISVRERFAGQDDRALAQDRSAAVSEIAALLPILGELSNKTGSHSFATQPSPVRAHLRSDSGYPAPNSFPVESTIPTKRSEPMVSQSSCTQSASATPGYFSGESDIAKQQASYAPSGPPSSILPPGYSVSLACKDAPAPLTVCQPPPYLDWMAKDSKAEPVGNSARTGESDVFIGASAPRLSEEFNHVTIARDDPHPSQKKIVSLFESLGLKQHISRVLALPADDIGRLMSDDNSTVLDQFGLTPADHKMCLLALNTVRDSEAKLRLKTQRIEEHVSVQNSQTKQSDKAPLQRSQQRRCAICLDKSIEIVLLNCGHACSCLECSESLTECPICRSQIARRVQIYIA
ncbi:hypothetical protein SARC_08149 [Sphaeroforma arctica JP610]|uniref:RING-type domain-containing protein n=1 Tax=Sphaeroforma arctica JP610 TaxID=667725 RepID=A0A0L0FS80_9EUKA|nr:hypothetical protein, variant [Sphaeroforma arctica JP610]XP_014153354.1 hypothetical protein SARC_08149 [Sphaeroforma arctica JP610]KNC79451.1 hypothetical protein, variant [Sphaeroforma arctica JP610]KNC79452.1 hypothetical protein SARC_08149 [Sphaeroforma arctica JP610]|eukprot:XP_014153353.1 hypothetical protein, variant [Sphaeroforma arctica JP610]